MKLAYALLIVGLLAASNCDLANAEKDRYRGCHATLEQFKECIPLGATREWVVEALGSPNYEDKLHDYEVWAYYGIVMNPITGNKKNLRLKFKLDGDLYEVAD